jgi:tetratricopeptide (TPR) repeat protein
MSDRPEKPSDNPAGEPEEIEALAASDAAKVMDGIERNRNKILIGAAVLALAICGALVASQIKKQKELDAANAYSAALSKKEIAAFDGVAVSFPGTPAAGNAMLSKAELQIDQGKPEDAGATLEAFLNDFSGHARYAQGLFALANLYHTSGDAEKAKSFYEKTIEVQEDGELTPLARIRLGDLALEAGDKATAEQRYEESYTLHPGNPFFEYSQDKIALLKVGNPPVVERPAPEPESEQAAEPETPKPAAPKPEAETPTAAGTKAPQPAPGNGKAKEKGKKAQSPPAGPGKAKAKAAPGNGEKGKAKAGEAPKPKAPAPKAKAPAPKAKAPAPEPAPQVEENPAQTN